MLCRANEAPLFVLVDRVAAHTEISTTPKADFDEHQLVRIGHHEIDLTESRAVIARNQTQAAAQKITFGRALRAATEIRCSCGFTAQQ